MLGILIAVATATSLAGARSEDKDKPQAASTGIQNTALRIIEDETAMHARIHSSLEFRVAISPLGFIAVAAAYISLAAFAKQDIPFFVTAGIVITGILGIIPAGFSLFASMRNLHRRRTPQQIREEAFVLANNPDMLIDKAAAQLAAMEPTTFRKCLGSNWTLVLFGCSIIFLFIGIFATIR